ncbi:MAG: JAB domain-containing protein, partial [Eubacterium sp.]|nr:JAB domain-containing protein [Eubacterium sp.]
NYTVIKSCDDAVKCFEEMYMLEKENERLAVMCLDNSNGIINCRFVAEGTVNAMEISIRKIIELVLSFNSSAVVIAHNHPHGKAQPSMEDINFTLNLRNMLNSLSINLVDHVIIGENEVISMRSSLDYINYFEKDNK